MMGCFLAYTSPARGHLYPITGTLLELRDRGHEVHVRTLASEVGALREAGLYAEPVAPAIEELPLDDYSGATPEEGLAGGLRTFLERSRHEVPDLQRAIATIEPDFLLIDATTLGAAAAAQTTRLPWAQWIPFFVHYTLGDEPPVVPGLIPFTLAPVGMEALNAPREQLGLARITDPQDTFTAPLYLYFTAPSFEVEGIELPTSFRMVGPGVWEPPTQPPPWLDELEDPLVLVTASSEFQRDDALIEAALEAVRGEDMRLVATTVAHDPEQFDPPPNARVERFLRHGPVIARGACVVCHGGMGITQRALAAGVPICVVPFGRDQMEVAGRVVASGAGTRVMPDELAPSRLRDAIREAMGMREGAKTVAEGFKRAGGARAAADELEALAATTGAAIATR